MNSIIVREETILWLTKDKIEDNEKRITEAGDPELVGSGQSVGGIFFIIFENYQILTKFYFLSLIKNIFLGVISEVVGTAEAGPQLQRIVSRCKCEFYYVAYGESSLEGITDRLPRRPEINPW